MYAYQAALWCDSCGQAIREELDKAKVDDSGDTDDYPQYADEDSSETDSPSHCDAGPDCLEAETLSDGIKVGALLAESLTADGKEYVRKAIALGGSVAELWAAQWPVWER